MRLHTNQLSKQGGTPKTAQFYSNDEARPRGPTLVNDRPTELCNGYIQIAREPAEEEAV